MPNHQGAAALRSLNVLRDLDWFTVLGALLRDRQKESRSLLNRLMKQCKHGRQVQLLRYIQKSNPTVMQMRRVLNVSRRTVFRYLNDLEALGIRLTIDGKRAYHIERMPDRFRGLV
jgi:hypothetical protein